ncbi:MAG TPA: class I SAM-dependent methyltransferase, partial [Pirellulaceae bacterium]|nr:class I SAM-dependent methyltransferase [Pirellulaceae bacterium]
MSVGHACDLCGRQQFEPLSSIDRHGEPLQTVVCAACGLVSHAEIPTDRELENYYLQAYRQQYHGEFTPSAYRVVREWKRGQRLLAQLRPDVQPGERVFEVGAGIGCTVMNFALAGFDASGIEPHDGFRQFSVEKLHARITAGFLDQLPARPQYDLVLLVHVLEHFPSPATALRKIRDLLRVAGRVYVEVPNFACPHAAPGKQFHYAHIHNFTPATLRMTAAKAGLVVKRALTAPFAKNIGLLVEASDEAELRIEPQSYAQTMAAVRRYSTLTYHLRPSYLRDRAEIFLGHCADRWRMKQKLAKILQLCDE